MRWVGHHLRAFKRNGAKRQMRRNIHVYGVLNAVLALMAGTKVSMYLATSANLVQGQCLNRGGRLHHRLH